MKKRESWVKKVSRPLMLVSLCICSLIFSACSQAEDPALAQINEFIDKQNIDRKKAGWKRNLNKPPQIEFEKNKSYFWELRTNKGNLTVLLMADTAPMHVSSTIYLTKLGFYDGLDFHRVITGFMAQGGDPMGNGMGGPGYKYSGEFSPNVKHDKPGVLSMANSGEDTDGSQFFLTFKPTPHLDGRHTIFGQVIMGIDTLNRLESFGSYSGKPKEKLTIKSATIRIE